MTGRPRDRASTLVEVLVAVAILALLAGLLAPTLDHERRLAHRTAAVRSLEDHARSLLDAWRDRGAFPAALADRDPWGRDLVYRTLDGPPDQALVLSAGPDGALSSDLSSWADGLWTDAGDDIARRVTTRPLEVARAIETEATLDRVRAAVGAFASVHARLPTDLAEVVAAGFLAGDDRLDRWGLPLDYDHPVAGRPDLARIASRGIDRTPATDDDLVALVADRPAALLLDPALVGSTTARVVVTDAAGNVVRVLDADGLAPDEPLRLAAGEVLRVAGGPVRLGAR